MSEYIRAITGTIEIDTNKQTYSLEWDVDSFDAVREALEELFARVSA